MIEISVVIPTFNRAGMIDRCLEHLAHQRLVRDRFEVIVVDDASTDDTQERLRRWADDDRVDVRVVLADKSFAGGARNRGSNVARGPRILFLGDDILATPDLLDRHLDGARRWGEDAVLVGEVQYTDLPAPTPFMRWMEERGVHHDFPRLRSLADSSVPGRYFYACNASVPASALVVAGGFDERIRRAWEDTEMGVRLERSGFRLHFLPGVTGRHVHPTDLREYTRFLRAGRADVGRAVDAMRALGEDLPMAARHPWLDRIVTDRLVDRVVALATSADRVSPSIVRAALYERIVRYERRRGLQAASSSVVCS